MNPLLARRIQRKLQRELVKRELNKYFAAKGYMDNMQRPLYPPLVIDLPIVVKQLFIRCEVVPYCESVDVSTGIHKIGWNLFVLGTNRLNLGYTSHTSSTDIIRATRGEANNHFPAEMSTTPDDVISFILNILDNSKVGYVELPSNWQIPMGAMARSMFGNGARSPRMGPSASGSFYSGPR